MKIVVDALSPLGISLMGQLFVCGPVWDGHLISKIGRHELLKLGLASSINGFTYLTEQGVLTAAEWDYKDLVKRKQHMWANKTVHR